jgi:ABC-type Fe3+ transport system substrate-binding protein
LYFVDSVRPLVDTPAITGRIRARRVEARTMNWLLRSIALLSLLALIACAPAAAPSPAAPAPKPAAEAEKAAKTPEAKPEAAKSAAAAEGPVATTPDELYQQMLGKSRDVQMAVLERGARQEANLDLYTSGDDERIKSWLDGFKKAHPYVDVKYTRGSTRTLTERFITQARAGQPRGDAFFAGIETLAIIRAEGLSSRYVVPDVERVPQNLRNDHHHWTVSRQLSHHAAFNNKMISADQIPNSFDDFASPEWQGKFSINSDAKEWFACMAKVRGKDGAAQLMRSITANQPIVYEGKSVQLERMTLGEFAVNIDNTGSTMVDSIKNGAPIGFKSINPICTTLSGGLLPNFSKNFHAAVLLYNYSTSPEAQRGFAQEGYLPLTADVAPADPAMRPAGAQIVVLNEQDLDPANYRELGNLHTEIVVRGR